jgi:hypothetical protein
LVGFVDSLRLPRGGFVQIPFTPVISGSHADVPGSVSRV